ncbi:MAG: choice-of-anchor J domain-containing protein [Ignavibacteria bacterium]|nr:choice-of-anchor J domain-containing protein [Ignavibacteria bacterium]
MKKLFLLLISFILLGSLDLRAQYKLNEGFESVTFPPDGWSRVSEIGSVQWVRTTTQFRSGVASAFINYEAPAGLDWLITKRFTPGANDSLTFWIRKQFAGAFPPDSLIVYISTTDSTVSSFTTVLASIDVANLTAATWIKYTIPLNAYAGMVSWIGFKHLNSDGNGCYIDDVSVGLPVLNDVGVSAYVSPNPPFCPGAVITPTVTVQNFGENPQSNINVYYTQNGGMPVGPLTIPGPLAFNGTANVLFDGMSSITLINGVNTIKFYTSLPGDQDLTNDTLTMIFNVGNNQTLPFSHNFNNLDGWTTSGTSMWFLGTAPTLVDPNGGDSNTAAYANFYNVSSGTGFLRSPLLDFTLATNPVLNFFVAYRSYAGDNDRLQVFVSVDGGNTWNPTTYDKSRLSNPSLSTTPDGTSSFFPTTTGMWRQETVDLSAYAGNSCVMIAFVGTTAFGNNCFIDNLTIQNVNNFAQQTINATGPVNFIGPFDSGLDYGVTVDFTAIGPAGGSLNFSRTKSAPQSFSDSIFVFNGSATTQDGSIFRPDRISPDGYYTLTYDHNNAAVYNISINISGYTGVLNANKLYIVKRTDANGPWVPLSTTFAADVLTATGVTGFSQFGIASLESENPLPVELTSFTADVNRNNVVLNWSTSSETNNAGFDIERKSEGSEVWSKIGSVNGAGNSNSVKNYTFNDNNLNTAKYNYRLKQKDFNGNFEYFNLSSEIIVGVPSKFDLSQNYPNPFNPSTKINYDLPFDSKVTLKVFDIMGREVYSVLNSELKTAGYYTSQINFSSLSSGTYFYRIIAVGLNGQEFVTTKKMQLLK